MRLISELDQTTGYDAVLIGSGFGTIFFLHKFLRKRPRSRILILEWGQYHTHQWQIENARNSALNEGDVINNQSGKPWAFSVALGGGSNCWWGQTPRLHPSDFSLKSTYGVGADWPVTYDELTPYFNEAEQIMMIAGPDDLNVEWPNTNPYPQPPHNMTSADRIMKAAMPNKHFVVPNARLSVPVGSRPPCCATGNCWLCPGDSKFTIINTLMPLLDDSRVDIMLGAKVEHLIVEAGQIRGVVFKKDGAERTVSGDLYVLGANAMHSPFIMMRSGLGGHGLGRYLCEKMYAHAEVMLDGLNHFDGGTGTTCFNTTYLDGPHRSQFGSNVIYIENRGIYGMRTEYGRWRQVMPVSYYIEDIPQESNGISIGEGDIPVVDPFHFTDYAYKSLDHANSVLHELVSSLPVESIHFREIWATLGHIQGTTRMGTSIENSVIDGGLIHHGARNLVVVGSSTFPTTGSVNISVTVAALSLRAADKLTRSA
ncbi:MAG: GMC family oxidoreductase [Hyphomonadaceae bacterium]|nr:GMC family oxidoreductase [Hyphomonadaceae bacterium]